MIPAKETLTVEFKSDKQKIADSAIFEAVVALANTDGGDIYLGVEDDGAVTGVHATHENPLTLGAYIANNTVPPISVKTELLRLEKPVIKISVPKSYGGIAATASGKILRRRIKLDGTPENTPMYPTELSTRLSQLSLLDYSSMLVYDASISDLDPVETERLRNVILAYEGDRFLLELPNEDLYLALGFAKAVEGRLIPTITGLLMIGRVKSILTHIPTHSASFQVLEGSRVVVNEDMALPLLATFDKLNTFMDARNPERELEIGMFRMSIPDFNKRAIREAMINAFSHRDYTRMGRVRVCVTDEGLTIANPGGFIEGVTISNLLTAEPRGRNPSLSDALKRVGLAEKTGRGIDRIFEGSLLYGRLLPDYSASTSTTISLLLPRCAPDIRMTSLISNEQKRRGRPLSVNALLVLNALRDTPGIDARQIANITRLSEPVVRTVLDDAKISGLVDTFAKSRGSTYRISRDTRIVSEKAVGYAIENSIDESSYPQMVIDLASTRKYISRADVINLLHITESLAYRVLKKLVGEGKLKAINKGRYSRYYIE